MKKMMMLIMAALTISLGTVAQEEQQQSEKREQRQMNQDEMVQRRTDAMVKKYGLNETQAAQLLELNKQFAKKMAPRRGAPGRHDRADRPRGERRDSAQAAPRRAPRQAERPDSTGRFRPGMRGQMSEEMRKNMEEYEAGLKKIMTEEQFKAYQEDQKNRRQPGRRPGQHRRN